MPIQTKISGLPSANSPDGSELVPIVQGGTTSKTTVKELIPYKVWTALLYQNTLQITAGPLIVGRSYLGYQIFGNDDFTNVGYIDSITPFIATGTTPNNWANLSILIDCTTSAPQYTSADVNGNTGPLIDTIGITEIQYLSPSIYAIKSNGAFISGKTFLFSPSPFIAYMLWADTSTILIQADGDNLIGETLEVGLHSIPAAAYNSFEIRVYQGLPPN